MSKKATDPFELYRMPIGLTDGIKIDLPETGASFMVKLPSTLNEEFQMRLMTDLNVQIGSDAKPVLDIKPIEFQARQKALFFEICIVSAQGLPKGLTPAEFFTEYPLAARYVFDKANELAAQSDADVERALGKSEPSQPSSNSGQASSTSTTH